VKLLAVIILALCALALLLLPGCTIKGEANVAENKDSVHGEVLPGAVRGTVEQGAIHTELQPGAVQSRIEGSAPVTLADGAVRGEMRIEPQTTFAPNTRLEFAPGTVQFAPESMKVVVEREAFKSEWRPEITGNVQSGAVTLSMVFNTDLALVGWAAIIFASLTGGGLAYYLVRKGSA
jgi:hypothetical protein